MKAGTAEPTTFSRNPCGVAPPGSSPGSVKAFGTNASAAVVAYARIKKLVIGCWMIHDLRARINIPKCRFMSSSDAEDLEKM
jgi:hypothetical protein